MNTDYFTRAVKQPDDYLAQRILADSPHGEASYLKAAKFLPPIADYVVIGDTHAPIKAVVAMDGKIKRSDGGDGPDPTTTTSDNAGDSYPRPAEPNVAPSVTAGGCKYSPEKKHVSVHVCAADKCKSHPTLAEAKAACDTDSTCGGRK